MEVSGSLCLLMVIGAGSIGFLFGDILARFDSPVDGCTNETSWTESALLSQNLSVTVEDVGEWLQETEHEYPRRFDARDEKYYLTVPGDKFDELHEILGAEDETPQSMGWVGSDGLP